MNRFIVILRINAVQLYFSAGGRRPSDLFTAWLPSLVVP